MRPFVLLVVSMVLAAALVPTDSEVTLPCTADMNISSYEGETECNYGASTRLRLKGIQMLGLLRFDCAPLAGQEVLSATLRLRYAGGDRRLRTIGLSTVAANWDEGSGVGERKAGMACFAERALGREGWAGPGSDLTDVMFTRGNTLAGYSDCQDERDDWIAVDVPVRLVEAMVAGVSRGLAVSDEKGQTMANNDVFSREQSGSGPTLTVRSRLVQRTPPGSLTGLSSVVDRSLADFESTGLRIEFTAPDGALAVVGDVQVSGRSWVPIPQAVLPYCTPGARQAVHLDGLEPERAVRVRLRAVGPSGLLGPFATVITRTGSAKPKPAALPRASHDPAATATVASGDSSLSAALLGGPRDPWRTTTEGTTRATGALRQPALRGETVPFAVTVANRSSNRDALALTCIGAFPVRLFLVQSVPDGTGRPEVCVPISLDASGRATLPHVRFPAHLLVEPHVPIGCAPGPQRVQFDARVGQGPLLRLAITFDVLPVQLPARPSFDLSLNTYGSPARAAGLDPTSTEGRAMEFAYHRIAHEHRATLTPLGYSHSGQIEPGYAPDTKGSGANRTPKDWQEWDRRFGPLLDGSAFSGTARGAIPVTHLYLPFHEAWPEDIRAAYAYVPGETRYPEMITEHAMRAGPIATLLPSTYGQGIEAMVRAFLDHIRERNWTRTTFHFYLNNKHYYKDPAQGGRGTSWWLLDEPNHRDDWLALAWFASRLKSARAGHPVAKTIAFREDISRPQWQRDYLDGLVDLMVVGGELKSRPKLLRDMQRHQGVTVWQYGSAPAPGGPLVQSQRLVVDAYLLGADGYVPWQTVGADSALDHPEETALILPGRRLGLSGPAASIRLKAMRSGQQLVEQARLLAATRKWDRDQLGAALAPYLAANDLPAMRAAVLRVLADAYGAPSRRSQAAIRSGHSAATLPRAPRPKP